MTKKKYPDGTQKFFRMTAEELKASRLTTREINKVNKDFEKLYKGFIFCHTKCCVLQSWLVRAQHEKWLRERK